MDRVGRFPLDPGSAPGSRVPFDELCLAQTDCVDSMKCSPGLPRFLGYPSLWVPDNLQRWSLCSVHGISWSSLVCADHVTFPKHIWPWTS